MNGAVRDRRLPAWWILVGALAVVAFGTRAASDERPASDTFYRYDAAAAGFVLYLLVLVLTLLIARGLDVRDAFALRRPASWGRAAAIAGGTFVAMWIVAASLDSIFGAGEEQGLDPDRITAGDIAPFVLSFAVVALFGPAVEELLYRGIGVSLLEHLGSVAAIAVTALAFALAHGIAAGIPVFFVIGAALAFVRIRTGSIYPAILMHGAFNGAQLVIGALA